MYKVLKYCYTCLSYTMKFYWEPGEMKTTLKKIISVILVLFMAFFMFVGTAFAIPTYSGEVDSYAVVLIDADSGRVLYEKNADERIVPASTTKMLTCLLALEYGNLTAEVEISKTAAKVKESSINLKEGERILFKDLVYATLIKSGNDGAAAIAETVAGSVPAFVDMMNAKASELGMLNSQFINPHGLPGEEDDENNYTTASDMAKLATYAIKNPGFMEIAGLTSYTIPANNKRKRDATYTTTNRLLRESLNSYYSYATGMKTGYTDAAGYCLVASAQKNGMNLICLIFKDDTETGTKRWTIAKNMFEFGFENYETLNLNSLADKLEAHKAQVENHSASDRGDGLIEFEKPVVDGKFVTLSKEAAEGLQDGSDSIEATVAYTVPEPLQAPILKGDVVGAVVYKSAKTGEVIYEGNLVASRDVLEAGTETNVDGGTAVATMTPSIPKEVKTQRDNLLVWLWGLIPLGLIVFLVVRLLTVNKANRKKHNKRRKPQYSYKIRR